MLLAHRRRSGTGRGRADAGARSRGAFRGPRRDRSRGAVLVEAAFVTPVFFTLVFGMIELSLAMNDNLALASSVRAGTRVASASGNDLYADYGIVRAIARESAALPRNQIKMIVVYRASRFGEAPPADCQKGIAKNPGTSTTAAAGNVYYPSDFTVAKSQWGCKSTDYDNNWCPTKRKISLAGTGTEYVGVWIKVEHQWITHVFGDKITLTDQSVIRLEPRVK